MLNRLQDSHGKTLSRVSRECGLGRHSPGQLNSAVKAKMKYFPVPPDQTWRIEILSELLNSKVSVGGLDSEEVKTMIAYLCTE